MFYWLFLFQMPLNYIQTVPFLYLAIVKAVTFDANHRGIFAIAQTAAFFDLEEIFQLALFDNLAQLFQHTWAAIDRATFALRTDEEFGTFF